MDYATLFKEKDFGENPLYPQNDIGIARLFFDLHQNLIRYVIEPKTWFAFDGRRWTQKKGMFHAAELCKAFTQAFSEYTAQTHSDDADLLKWAGKLTARRNRDGILCDARSIAPMSIADFDRSKLLFNCANGTLNLQNFALQNFNHTDFITKLSDVKYDVKAQFPRWELFIDEVMCGDAATSVYLQKALGYSLTGLTEYESFYILFGATTRNGKSTLIDAVTNVLGDYACTIQPQTLARRSTDGAAASPDIARLKGARLVNMPEPEKGLELNAALIKQMTGGDKITVRAMYESPIEMYSEFKPFINTNHLPRTTDNTIFTSGRVKVIPFERHFTEEEQDTGLKKAFGSRRAMSAILNWLVAGYRLLLETGFDMPERVRLAVAEYRQETDVIGAFLSDCVIEHEGSRIPTPEMYTRYVQWAGENGYKPLNNRNFVGELRLRCDIRKNRYSNVAVGLALADL
jgi:putative DNA primase/helicase